MYERTPYEYEYEYEYDYEYEYEYDYEYEYEYGYGYDERPRVTRPFLLTRVSNTLVYLHTGELENEEHTNIIQSILGTVSLFCGWAWGCGTDTGTD